MSLPRELLVWLQSLSLSHVLKYPKRDLCNGYLVAEILSRYYPQEIDIQQYRTGSSMEQRMSNWEQIERITTKLGINISHELIQGVMRRQDNRHITLLVTLYNTLTQKKIHADRSTQKKNSSVCDPSFAAPTASTLIRHKMVTSDLADVIDEKKRQEQLAAVKDEHNKAIRSQRSKQSSRVKQLLVSSQRRVPMRVEESKEQLSSNPLLVLSVTVKQTANPDLLSLSSLSSLPQQSSSSSSAPQSSLSALSHVILNTPEYCNDSPTKLLQTHTQHTQHTQAINSFIQQIPIISDTVSALVIQRISSDALPVLVSNAINNPKDFYVTFSLLWAALVAANSNSKTYEQLISLLTSFAWNLRSKDAFITQTLFNDFVLPKMIQTATTHKDKLYSTIRLSYEFIQEDTQQHQQLLQTLREQLADDTLYLRSLCSLVALEDFTSPAVFTQYENAVTQGVRHKDADNRALSLALLATMISSDSTDQSKTLLTHQWSLLPSMTSDEWPVQAELVHIISCLLTSSSASTLNPMFTVESLQSFVTSFVSPSSSFSLLVACIPYLSPLTASQPLFRALFLNILTERDDIRVMSLGGVEATGGADQSSPTFAAEALRRFLFVADLRSVWHPLTILRCVMDQMKAHRQTELNSAQVELIAAAVSDACDESGCWEDKAADDYGSLFLLMREHLIQAALKHQTLIYSVLSTFLTSKATQGHALSIFLGPHCSIFHSHLLAVIESQEEERMQLLLCWLSDLCAVGDDVILSVLRKSLLSFRSQDVTRFESSGLQHVPIQGQRDTETGNATEVTA